MKSAILSFICLILLVTAVQGAEETVTLINGQQIKVLYFEPDDATTAPPLAVLMSGGSNSEFMARAQFWMGKELVSRGWAIAVPISPGGRSYFEDNAQDFPDLINHLRQTHELKPGKTLLVGISTGGSAALAIAARKPDQYLGVIATPGRLQDNIELDPLNGLPIYLRVGEKDDFRWDRQMNAAVEQLENAGARVNAALVPGARHIFPLNWEELEPWLGDIQR